MNFSIVSVRSASGDSCLCVECFMDSRNEYAASPSRIRGALNDCVSRRLAGESAT